MAEECTDVRSCKRWRREIVQEISQKMAQIQNAGLGEFRLRDLNDEINKESLRYINYTKNQAKSSNLVLL